MHSASRAMPALPGAHHNFVSSGDAAIFHARACSRPPEPSRRMFIGNAAKWRGCRLLRDGLARREPAATTRPFLCGYVPRCCRYRLQTLRKRRKRPILSPDMPAENLINAPEFTVSELSSALKRTVEDAYGHVRVRGEISGFRGPH